MDALKPTHKILGILLVLEVLSLEVTLNLLSIIQDILFLREIFGYNKKYVILIIGTIEKPELYSNT